MKLLTSLVVLEILVCIAVVSHAQNALKPEDLINGVWMSETVFGPALSGELTVLREKDHGISKLADARTEFEFKGSDVQFSFGKQLGKFRGTVVENGNEIRGFWLQPSSVTTERPDAVGSRQAFATPVSLKREKSGSWSGTVVPLDERFTLFLKFYRNDEGNLVAAFRNHDFNSTGHASVFQVTQADDQISFSARPDESQPEIRYTAKIASGEHLQMFWPDAGKTFDLVHRSLEQAPAFLPRPHDETYSYKQPEQTGDGWTTARASDVGIDEAGIVSTMQKIIAMDPAARRPSLIHSILVAYRSKLVIEEYFFGFTRDLPHDSRSAGKTFASVLLGTSMRNGIKIGPESKIYDLLREQAPFANPDPRKSQITLAHLMTHTAGFACNDNDEKSPGNEDLMQRQSQQPNWWKYTLDLPMAHDPGTRYTYCSANTNLVGGALTVANKTWLPELFDKMIARPLQFSRYHWNLMPNEEGYLGGGVFLRSRDLLKIGQTYLNGGAWNGKRIVDESWVRQSTASHVKINPQSTGLTPEEFSDYYIEAEDALAWHLGTVHSGKRSYSAYLASGNGGQLLIVIPEIQLTAVFTGANYGQGGIWLRWPDQILGAGIIPAIAKK